LKVVIIIFIQTLIENYIGYKVVQPAGKPAEETIVRKRQG
jgi:hypothetical protein